MTVEARTFRSWSAHGINCAVALGTLGLCGYVRLPVLHPDRVAVEARDVRVRVDQQAIISAIAEHGEWHYGHDALDYDVHGGLNYGIDPNGWVGFDTAHAFDVWTDKAIAEIPPAAPGFEDFMARRYVGRMLANMSRGPSRDEWTVEALAVEVERLAEQAASRA